MLSNRQTLLTMHIPSPTADQPSPAVAQLLAGDRHLTGTLQLAVIRDHWDSDRILKLALDEYCEDVMAQVCDVCVSVRKQKVQFSSDRFIRDQRQTQLLMSGGSFRIPASANISK